MEASHVVNIKKTILMLKEVDNDELILVDDSSTLRVVDTHEYKTLRGFKTNLQQSQQLLNGFAIDKSAKYFFTNIPDTNKATLFSIQNKKQLYTVARHKGTIESVAIDPKLRQLVTGGIDGKVFVWNLKTSKLAYSLTPHADYVTAISFSSNGQWIASGGFDRVIHVQNLATMKPALSLRAHSKVIVKIIFLPDLKLLSSDKDGNVLIWDLKKGTLFQRLPKVNDEITDMTISPDSKYLFVSTKLGYVALYDLSDYSLMKQNFLKLDSAITALEFISATYSIAIGTQNGDLKVFSLLGDEEKLRELMIIKDFATIYQAFDDNPLLRYSSLYVECELYWAQLLKECHPYLEKGDLKTVRLKLSPFKAVPKFNVLIQDLLKSYDKYSEFQKHVVNKKFPLAYSMVKQFPGFKDSEYYKKMERLWKKSFIKAQELILNKDGDEKAKELLAPFRGISEKAKLIQELFSERNAYLLMKRYIANKDFLSFFNLIGKNQFLTEFKEYELVMNYADSLYLQAAKALEAQDLHTAYKLQNILLNFPDYKNEALEITENIKAQQDFEKALQFEDLPKAFRLLETNPFLYESEEGAALEMQWNEKVSHSYGFCSKGDIESLNELFEDYFEIEAKYSALASIYAQAYIAQLEHAIKDKVSQESIERGMRNYIKMFGLDEGIAFFSEIFLNRHKSQFDIHKQEAGNIILWRPFMIISSIL